jgi:hypothetical protein
LKLHPNDMRANWMGADLPQRPDWCHQLTPDEIEECIAFASEYERSNGAEDLSLSFESMLPTFFGRLKRIQADLETGSGATRLTGFPVDQVSDDAVERIFLLAMTQVGTPVSQSIHGETVFHVRDEGYKEGDPRARGPSSKNRLTFHSDRCDVISFLCLQDAKHGGDNQIVSSIAIFEKIERERPDLARVLMEPFWYQRHNVDTGNKNAFYQQPVFSIYQERFASSLLRVLIDRAYQSPDIPEMTTLQREGLDLIEELACRSEMHLEFRQERGDIVLLNNFVTLHRRTAFEDHQDENRRRHLLRVWLSMPNSRSLDPLFAASYGNTAAGSVRGGMRVAAS